MTLATVFCAVVEWLAIAAEPFRNREWVREVDSDRHYDYEREPIREWEQEEWCDDCERITMHLWLKWQPYGQVTDECQVCGMVSDQW